ncbi:MAG: thioesterase [Defluviitaleaceae bacterium]|nr:thioesterase [Defluviitaleaceae bacterium]
MENPKNQNLNPNKFNVDYRIGFSGLLPDKTLALPGFMALVQEASMFHTSSIPGAFDYYDEMNWVWVLTHWQVEAFNYPKVGDEINISTWPVRFKGYFGERGFEAVSAQGKTLLSANSNWILLDRTNQAPVRSNEYISSKYGENFPFLLEKDFSLPKHDDFAPLSIHEYTTTRRDIDTNNHVNNVKYLEWMYCYIPEDIYHNYRAKSLKVAYKKETLLGDKLEIKLFQRQRDEEVEIFAVIEKDGLVATEIYTIWKKT